MDPTNNEQKNSHKLFYLGIVIMISISILGWFYFNKTNTVQEEPIPVSYKDIIEISNIAPGQIIGSSPVIFNGKARGPWFFEASFPVHIVDAKGFVLGTGIAQAQGEWMTEDYVPFRVEINFVNSTTQEGTVEFVKDNPSGLPEFEDSFTVPIKFY